MQASDKHLQVYAKFLQFETLLSHCTAGLWLLLLQEAAGRQGRLHSLLPQPTKIPGTCCCICCPRTIELSEQYSDEWLQPSHKSSSGTCTVEPTHGFIILQSDINCCHLLKFLAKFSTHWLLQRYALTVSVMLSFNIMLSEPNVRIPQPYVVNVVNWMRAEVMFCAADLLWATRGRS